MSLNHVIWREVNIPYTRTKLLPHIAPKMTVESFKLRLNISNGVLFTHSQRSNRQSQCVDYPNLAFLLGNRSDFIHWILPPPTILGIARKLTRRQLKSWWEHGHTLASAGEAQFRTAVRFEVDAQIFTSVL
jgi:hypothetical protein